MRRIFVFAALTFVALQGVAQEKVMKVLKTDGTCSPTRVADLDQISFLAVGGAENSLVVKTVGGETATVLFEANPVVTAADGKLVVVYSSTESMEFEISDVAEIVFNKTSDGIDKPRAEGLSCVLRDGSALIRGIPAGAAARVYSIDGRSLQAPQVENGELRLDRSTLGRGVFIVKVGALATKIKL